MHSQLSTAEKIGWSVLIALLPVFAIPWFLWGTDQVRAGLPLWLWWHIGWMVVAAVVFWLFTKRAWGLGITDSGSSDQTRRDQA